MKKTFLHNWHLQLDATLVDFAGYSMPLYYHSQLNEHRAVRENCGMFDVSHMQIVDITGHDAKDFLCYLLPTDINTLKIHTGFYTCLLNNSGGIIDDVIIYQCLWGYRLVSNAASKDLVKAHLEEHALSFQVNIKIKDNLGMIALQGNQALDYLSKHIDSQVIKLKRFGCNHFGDFFVARTGYTGGDGFEIIADQKTLEKLWSALVQENITCCGLGARDILRLEAGLLLSGQDMNDSHTPWESKLGYLVHLDQTRFFLGFKALLKTKNSPQTQLYYAFNQGRIPRVGSQIQSENGQHLGQVTSSSFSPILKKSITILRLKTDHYSHVHTTIANKSIQLTIMKQPCFCKGKYNLKHQKLGEHKNE